MVDVKLIKQYIKLIEHGWFIEIKIFDYRQTFYYDLYLNGHHIHTEIKSFKDLNILLQHAINKINKYENSKKATNHI